MALTGEFAFIEEALDELTAFVRELETSIPAMLREVIELSLQTPAGTDLPDILGLLSEQVASAEEVTRRLEQRVIEEAEKRTAETRQLIEDLQADILRNSNIVINESESFAAALEASALARAEAETEETQGLFSKLQSKVTGFFGRAAAQEEELFGENFAKVTGFLNKTIDDAQTLTQTAVSKAEAATRDLATVFEAEIGKLPEALSGEFAKSMMGPLGGILDFLGLFETEKWEEAFSILDQIWTPLEDDPWIGQIIQVLTPKGVPAIGIIGVLVVFPFISSLVGGVTSAIYSAEMELSRQTSFERKRPLKLPLSDLLELLRRNIISEDEATAQLTMQGWPDESIAALFLLRHQLLNITENITLWRRNEIDDDTLTQRLRGLGFADETHADLRTLAFAVPPVQDLVLFAVREVFQLERAAELGQLEGLPPDVLQAYQEKFGQFGAGVEGSIRAFAEFTKQAGVAPEWAAAYWAAHWRLPGVQSLFTMVHRLSPDILALKKEGLERAGLDVDALPFDMSELQKVLRAQDFSPFFRERLTAIAFQPLTRVDVRRIHRLGLIPDDELDLRYRELGFSPDDAAKMREFTLAYNNQEDDTDEVETRDLTRTQILKFFENGAVEFDAAVKQLEVIGYTPAAALTFVSLKAADILDDEIALQLDVIKTRFKTEDIDRAEAGTLIDALGLPPLQKDKELARLELEVQRQEFKPSMSDLTKFVEEGIISANDYNKALRNRGVPKIWRDRYVVLNTGEEVQQRDVRHTSITVAEIDSLWESGRLTWQRYLDLLFSIGFTQDALESNLRDKQGGNITTPQGNYIRRKFV